MNQFECNDQEVRQELIVLACIAFVLYCSFNAKKHLFLIDRQSEQYMQEFIFI